MGVELSDRGIGFREGDKEPEVFLVEGAPGTGKTYVLNNLINELIAQREVNLQRQLDEFARLVSQIGQATEEEISQQVRETETEKKRNELIEAIENDLIVPIPISDDHFEQPPPPAAEYVLRFIIEEKDREIVIGDLCETYQRVRERKGKRRADFWMCYEVARSVWPFVRRLVVRITGRIVRTRRAD
jgi:sugar-specific transcriptional regulator TrmB